MNECIDVRIFYQSASYRKTLRYLLLITNFDLISKRLKSENVLNVDRIRTVTKTINYNKYFF
jgi:hypothetical protein